MNLDRLRVMMRTCCVFQVIRAGTDIQRFIFPFKKTTLFRVFKLLEIAVIRSEWSGEVI